MKKLLYIWAFIIFIIVWIALAWMYKFNIKNDDIYVQTSSWIVKMNDLPKIYTSFYPIEFLTRELVGNEAQIVNIVPNGWEAHGYEPTAGQIAQITKASAIVMNWFWLEPYEEKLIEMLKWTVPTILLAEQIKNPISTKEEHHKNEHHEDEHNHWDTDPHTWLSPKTMKEKSEILFRELWKVMTLKAENYLTLQKNLESLDTKFGSWLSNCAHKKFITSHEAFAYLARDYALEQIAIMGISPEEEPTASDIKNAIDTIKNEWLKAVYSEKLVSPKFAETIKKETWAEIFELDPLETLTSEQVQAWENYISIMEKNLEALRKWLECK